MYAPTVAMIRRNGAANARPAGSGTHLWSRPSRLFPQPQQSGEAHRPQVQGMPHRGLAV